MSAAFMSISLSTGSDFCSSFIKNIYGASAHTA